MGKAKKLKQQRRMARENQEKSSREKQKLFITSVLTVIILAVVGYFGYNWFNKNKKDNKMETQAVISTSLGDIKLVLYPEAAPKTVENFVGLAKKGYYDGTLWHRVIKDFMIQGGDPLSKDEDPSNDGTGGESLWGGKFADEINAKSLGLSDQQIKDLENQGYKYTDKVQSYKMEPGVIAMANSGPDTNGSQFFIVTTQSQSHLDGRHTVFGKVIEGLEVAVKISEVATDENNRPQENVVINKITISEKEKTTQENDQTNPVDINQIESDGTASYTVENLNVE